MNPEKIGAFIKKIRQDNNLSQKDLADKLGVTFQAVSKWERGINIPDILILNEISKEFNIPIDEILKGENNKKNNSKKIIFITIIIFMVICLCVSIIIIFNHNNNFEFNEVNTTNNEFSISGSVVISKGRTSLIINEVDYNGYEDDTIYKNLDCTLFEEENDKKKEITNCDKGTNITLRDYLENLKIKIDNYSPKCVMFVESKVFIEIKVSDSDNKEITYKIPLIINKDNC